MEERSPARDAADPSPVAITVVQGPRSSAVSAPRWLRPVGAAALALGGASLVVGGVMASLAADAGKQVSAASGEFTPALRSQDRLGQRYDQAGLGLFVAGGVLVVAGAVGVGLSFRSTSSATAASASLVPMVGPNAVGVITAGRF